MITFVRETQGLDFAGAIEWLGRPLPHPARVRGASRPDDDARRRRRERLYALLDQAATFYERYLWDSQAGSLARDYLAGRGLGEEICREFRLGLALGGNTLSRKAVEKGFTRRGAARGGARRASAAATTSSAGSSSRSPTRAGAWSASRRGGCTRTTRCGRST